MRPTHIGYNKMTTREKNIKFLRDNGVLWRWLRNVYREEREKKGSFKKRVNILLRLCYFISASFAWSQTPEGYEFWSKIEDKSITGI